MHGKFRHLKLSETPNGSSTKCFGTVRQNNFDGTSWHRPLSLILNIFYFYSQEFLISEFFWNTEGFHYEFFGTVTQKLVDRNSWYPLLCMKMFVTKIFLKHGSPTIFLVLWDKTFPTENRDTPSLPHLSLSSIKFCKNGNFLKSRRVPLRNFSTLWEQKFSTENLDTPPLFRIKYRNQWWIWCF